MSPIPPLFWALSRRPASGLGDELQKSSQQKGYTALREKLRELRHGHTAGLMIPPIPAGPVLRPACAIPVCRSFARGLAMRIRKRPASKIWSMTRRSRRRSPIPESEWSAAFGSFDGTHRCGLSGGQASQSSRLEAEIIAIWNAGAGCRATSAKNASM